MNEQEMFVYLLDTLKDISGRYGNYANNSLALSLLGIGWIVTSEGARTFLRRNKYVRRGTLVFIGMAALIFCKGHYQFWQNSEKLCVALGGDSGCTEHFWKVYEISFEMAAINSVGILATLSILALIVTTTAFGPQPEPPDRS